MTIAAGEDHCREGVVTVTVTFNPDPALLEAQLSALPQECLKIIVDNASELQSAERTAALAAAVPNTKLLRNSRNIGLAAALNGGVSAARRDAPEARFVLLLDQDSEPRAGSIAALVAAFGSLESMGYRVGCVGPLLLDATTGRQHGFHQATRWRWHRLFPAPYTGRPVACTNLNGSGTLVPIGLFLELGGLDEELFIDHVDTAWSFRVLAAGYSLWGIPQAVFTHRMGSSSLQFWLCGWRVWPVRPAARHYYLFRNAVLLMRRRAVPRVWKFWAVGKLALTALIHGLFDPNRREQLRQMRRGLADGLHTQDARR